VRAFEFLRQIHEHSNRRHRVLQRFGLVPNLDREAQPAHADFVDAQLAVVALALLVMQRRVGFEQRWADPPARLVFGHLEHGDSVGRTRLECNTPLSSGVWFLASGFWLLASGFWLLVS